MAGYLYEDFVPPILDPCLKSLAENMSKYSFSVTRFSGFNGTIICYVSPQCICISTDCNEVLMNEPYVIPISSHNRTICACHITNVSFCNVSY